MRDHIVPHDQRPTGYPEGRRIAVRHGKRDQSRGPGATPTDDGTYSRQ